MKHLTDGTLRRMLDEPDESRKSDIEHFAECDRCQEVLRELEADVAQLTARFGPDVEEPDLIEAFVAVNEKIEKQSEPAPKKQKAAPESPGSKILWMVGRGFVAVGTLILLFVGYQLIGTNLVTNNEQRALAAELETQWTSQVVEETPDLGQGVALIKIPKIGVDRVVVEGIGVEDLKKGPGHYLEPPGPVSWET